MFVDSSALIAIIRREPEKSALASRLEGAIAPVTSPLVVLETVMRLTTMLGNDVETARAVTSAFLDEAGIQVVPIPEAMGEVAIDAFSRFGKGMGHGARLNIADCLTYAAARELGQPILYKGNDFAATDLA